MKRVLAIFLVAAMLFGLIPGNAVAFAEDNTMFTESQFGTDFGTLANRDISKEKWTVKLSDGTVIPNAKVSSKKNAFIPGQFDYTVVFSQAELDKLAAPGKKIKILDKGHSIEVTKGKNAPLMKFSNGESEKKNGEYSVLLNLLLGPTAKIEEGVIVVNSEVVEKIAVAWKLETVDGKSLDGTVKLDGDYYVVQVKTDSLKKSVEEDRTFLGINTSGGGVYSIDGTGNNSKKVCDYTYHKVDKDFLEYKFEAQLVSSVNEGKIVFDLIAPNTKSSPKWEIKTKNGLTVPVTSQDFLNFIESPHDLYLPNNPFQNWVFGVYIKKDVLVEELKKQGYEFLGFDPEDTDNTVLNMSGIEYSLDGSAKKFEVTADLKNNRRYFFDISEDTDTAEYYCKIILNEKDKLIDLQSAVLYLDIRTKSLNKVIVDPNGGKVRYADLNTSEVTIHDKPFELKFNKDEEFYGPVNAFKKGERFLGWFYKDGDQIEFPFKVNGLYNIEARYEEIDYERNFKVNVIAKVEGDDKTYDILFPRSSRTSSTWTDNENLMKDSFITRISEGAISVALRDVLEDRQEFEITGYKVNLTGAYNYDKNQAVVVDASHQTFKKNGEDFEYEYTGQYEKSDGQIEGGTIVLNIKPGKKFYEVTFDVGDALFNGEKTQIVEKGSFVKNPTVLPFKKDFVFNGWYTNEDKPFEFDKMAINADTRIVAKFAPLMGAENKYGFRVYAKFEGIDEVFPLQGYTIERKLEPKGEYSNTVITARIERTKLSEQIEKLGFVLTDDLKSDIDLRGFQNYIDYEENDIFDDPDEVVQDDFIFDTKEATVTYSFFHKEETGQVEGGNILFVLQPNHRVKLELDGGKTPTASTFNVAKGSIIGEKLVPPTKRKYTFTGWMSGGKPFDPTKDVVTGNITLVAQYEPLKRYNGQGIKILFRHEDKIIPVEKLGSGGIVSMTAGKEGGEYIVKLQAVIGSKLVNKIVEPEQSYVRVLSGTVQSLKGHYTSKGSKENEKYMVSPDSDEFSPDHYQLLVEDYNVDDINGNPEIGKLFIIRIPLVEDYGQVESGVLIIDLELESNKKHKVTFYPNGGDFEGEEEVEVKEGKTVEKPKDPVKAGYKFLYWAVGSEDGEEYKFETQIKTDLKLVAKYTPSKYTLTINTNGGKIQSQFLSYQVDAGKVFSGPNGIFKPTLRGKVFDRWALPDSKTFDIGTYVFNSDVTLTAEYKDLPVENGAGFVVQADVGEKDPIRFEGILVTSRIISSDNSGEEKALIRAKIDEAALKKVLGDKYELIRIKKIDVDAKGHYANKDSFINNTQMGNEEGIFPDKFVEVIPWIINNTADPVIKVRLLKDVGQVEGGTITVELEVKKKHTVTLDVSGGTYYGAKEFKVADGEAFAEPKVKPFLAGHRFLGWYLGDTPYEFSSNVTSDITLVAKYIKIGDQKNWGFHVYLVTPDGERTELDQSVVKRIQVRPDGAMLEHRYEVVSTLDDIHAVLGTKWELVEIKNYVVKAVRRAVQIEFPIDPTLVNTIDLSDDKLLYRFYITLSKEQDILGGDIEIFVDAIDNRKPKHTITFNLDGGKYDGELQVVVPDERTLAEPKVAPTKAWHTFIEWQKDGVKYNFADPVTASFELKAFYEELPANPNVTHVVTFNPNGGVYYGLTEVRIKDAGTVAMPGDTPVRTGYKFLYWALGAEDGPQFDFNTKIRENITLVAVYDKLPEVKHTVTFDPNGGTLDGSADAKTVEVVDNTAVAEPSTPVMAGHKFLHWAVGIETGEKYEFTTFVTGDLKLVAVYEVILPAPVVKHKVTFDPNGGVYFGLTEVMIPDGGTVNVPADEPVKTGHKFLYWALEGETAAYNFDKPITQDITLVAVYESLNPAPINKFIVTFDPNEGMLNGSTAPVGVEVEENQKVVEPTNPMKDGHKFIEWRKDGAAYDFDSPVTESFTLVAYYEKENTGGNDGGNTGGNTGGNDNTGGNTGGNDNAGGNTGTGNNQGTTDSGVDFFPDTTTGSTGGTTGTVEIEEEGTPLSNVEKTDDVMMNGEKTSLKIGKDGTIVVTEADLKDVKDPILMSFKLENGDHTYVTFQKEGEKKIVIPISVYLDGRMHVVIAGPGTYVANEAPASFRGVPEKHWGMRFIQIVGARQLMVGNEHGDFMPDVPTTRAMFTQILARLQKVDLTSVQSNHYADVPMDKWYAASVNWATDQGIVNGVGGGKFAPEDAITREQMAVMIYHYLKRNNWKLIMKAGATQFADYELVSGWAKDAVTELKDYGIFEGKPGHKFDPKANATRAEVATVVARLLELYIKSLMMK